MERNDNEMGINTSSGEEKVERISEQGTIKSATGKSATGKKYSRKKTSGTKSGTPKKSEKSTQSKINREKESAKMRIDTALEKEKRKTEKAKAKAERKAKKAEEKARRKAKYAEMKAIRKQKRADAKAERKQKRLQMREEKQKRILERKAKKQEIAAQRKARKETLKHESATQKRKRIEKERSARLAMKKQKREQRYKLRLERRDARLKKREQKLNDKKHKREHSRTPGFGGWLAAVVTLGVVTLGLTAVVTLGAINMTGLNETVAGNARATLYELVGIVDDLDEDLNKVRVSADPSEQSKLLTNVLVETRLAEGSLEKIPVEGETDVNLTAFVNHTATTAERLLQTLRTGGRLTEKDFAELEKAYKTNHAVREELDGLASRMTDKDFANFMSGKKGNGVFETFGNLENLTIFDATDPVTETSASKSVSQMLSGEKITSSEAEGLCRSYFAEYDVENVCYAGETVSDEIEAYNFKMTDKNGREIYAEIAKAGGALVGFDSFEYCTDKNFDLENAQTIALDYLEKLGYSNMDAVWVNESGTSAVFTFCYDAEGTVYYPDSVKVRVCETRGKVVAFVANEFLKNHKVRTGETVKITTVQAEEKLSDKLAVENTRLTVVDVNGAETCAHEFICAYDGKTYFVYIDANTGREVKILAVEDSAQGKFLK